MKNIIYQLWHPTSNVEEVTILLLEELGLKVSRDTIHYRLTDHPFFPSFAAVSDTIRKYGVEALALKVKGISSLSEYAEPFIVQINTEEGAELLGLVYRFDNQRVIWYNPVTHQRGCIAKDDFCSLFTGYVLLPEVGAVRNEDEYKSKERLRRTREIIETLIASGLPIIAFVSLAFPPISLFEVSISILYLAGFVISCLLLLYEFNRQPTLVSKICNIGNSFDCGSVLHSNASRFLGIPWSVIGTSYFASMLMSACLSRFSLSLLAILAFVHVLAVIYAIYSIYYQSRIVNHWCPLCMLVQVINIGLFAVFLWKEVYFKFPLFTCQDVITLASCSFFAFSVIYLLWKLNDISQSLKKTKNEINNIKYNKEVFTALLYQGNRLETTLDNEVGIVLGNPNGHIRIIEVSQPYCSFCAEAQLILQHIIEANADVSVQIIFMADPDAEYYKELPIDQFLSLYLEGAEMETVLSDWYLGPRTNRATFTERYPVANQFTKENYAEAKKMYAFCEKAKIIGTPTIFINGYQLPLNYNVEALQYVFA